jgi:hypothetical protein
MDCTTSSFRPSQTCILFRIVASLSEAQQRCTQLEVELASSISARAAVELTISELTAAHTLKVATLQAGISYLPASLLCFFIFI